MRKFGRRLRRALSAQKKEKSKEAYYAEISDNITIIVMIIAMTVLLVMFH